MDAGAQAGAAERARLRVLPQIVPSHVCLRCDVCCRFPEPDSGLRPYFTDDEIRRAVEAGLPPAAFADASGGQVRVVPNPLGEGYLCPAFDPATSHCRIYEARPLDCRLYPFALMWSADGREVLLGWDAKCPFLREGGGHEAEVRAAEVAALLEAEDSLDELAAHPRLIGRFQEDVVVLRLLPRLTARLRPAASSAPRVPASPSSVVLAPLALDDRARFERAVAAIETPLGAYAFPYHFIWRRVLAYSSAELHGHLCLFAESPDGLFMPLPPLPIGEGTETFPAAIEACFAVMRARNGDSAVSRIENVAEELVPRFLAAGCQVAPKDADYLYRAEDLVRLAGDRYKSQRAACNRFARGGRFAVAPYRERDREACLALYRRWAAQREARGLSAAARHMLEDSASAHDEALTHAEALGLTGLVIRVEGAIAAYTAGYRRAPAVFCVLLEVADRSLPGLASFLFRECCREAAAHGAALINTLDDAGLPGLAASKRAYHPLRLASSFIATRPGP